MPSSQASRPQADVLDSEQATAVHASERAIAVLAGPGSGKTRTLSFRTRQLLSAGSGDALLLTFTNKAAAEMKARALAATGLAAARIHAATYHTFCAEVLRGHGDLVGTRQDFEILDQDEDREIAREVARELGIADPHDKWSQCRVRKLVPSDWLLHFGNAYQKEKLERGVLSFDDIVVLAADLLENRPELAAAYATRYPHILVDEFQDTNAAQFSVVRAVAAHARSVSVFADDDQAIFGFAGAEAKNIQIFMDELDAVEYPLTYNHRSREQIVAMANRLIAADATASGRLMKATRDAGAVSLHIFNDVDEEAAAVIADIRTQLTGGVAISGMAILVRRGSRAETVVRRLKAAGLPVSDWRGAAHEPEDRRLFSACLAVVHGDLTARRRERLCDLMGIPLLTDSGTEAFVQACAAHPLAAGLREVRRLAFEGASALQLAQAVQDAVAKQDPARAEKLTSIVNAVTDFEAYDSDFTVEHLLSELALGTIDRPPTEGGGVKVASLHRTKGLQWRHVYLLGLEEGHSPDFRATTPDVLSEERRLCFVGVSRAEDSLTVTSVSRDMGHRREPSRFLREMGWQM